LSIIAQPEGDHYCKFKASNISPPLLSQGQALRKQESIITYIVSIIDSRWSLPPVFTGASSSEAGAGMTTSVKNCAIIYAFNYKQFCQMPQIVCL